MTATLTRLWAHTGLVMAGDSGTVMGSSFLGAMPTGFFKIALGTGLAVNLKGSPSTF
jgi:hypothetical protein